LDSENTRIETNVLDQNTFPIHVVGGSGAVVRINRTICAGCQHITITEDARDGSVLHNTIEGDGVALVPGTGLVIDGMLTGADVIPVTGMSFLANEITSPRGIYVGRASDNVFRHNQLSGEVGLILAAESDQNRYWWNTILASNVGVIADKAVELTSGDGQGNWWGRRCPGVVFVPDVDSNRSDVTEPFAYYRYGAWLLDIEPGCDLMAPAV